MLNTTHYVIPAQAGTPLAAFELVDKPVPRLRGDDEY